MAHRTILTLVLAVLLCVGGATSLPAVPAGAAQPPTQVRVAHVAPGLGPVDIFVNGALALNDVPFGVVSGYVPVLPGATALAAVPNGAPPTATVFNAELSFDPGYLYTVLVLPELPGNAPVVLMDNPLAPPGAAQLRFVNASPNAPPLDLAIAGQAPLFSGIAFGQVSEYINLPPGVPLLELRQSGTLVRLDVDPVALPTSGTITVAAIGLVGGVPPLGSLVIPGS